MQLGRRTADTGGARDDAHALRVLELVHRFLELGPVVALDASADAAAARVVGHQDNVTSCQRDEGRQRRALVAALFLFDLDDQFLAFLDHVLNAGLTGRNAFGEILLGDFLERKEAVAVLAVVHEAGFERRLDARHDCLVDVAFALFPSLDLDFVVEELLPVDDRQAAFFGLRGIDQHPFHDALSFSMFRLVLPVHDGPNDARTARRETKELPLCLGLNCRANAGSRIEIQLNAGQGGGAWMGARPIGC